MASDHVDDAPQSHNVSLADKYDLTQDRVFLSGTQAIVRLLLMQKAIDSAAGLNTAGFVSGYRGSPLGGLDYQLQRAKAAFEKAHIVFTPGLNEDLAATAIWGAQQAEMRGEGRFDGVFSIWYGKGPGVDRSGDAFRHANLAGTSRYGGVLALMGDDHTAESSTTAHQSEFDLLDKMMPILSPAGVQELLDFGLMGFALSRYAGVWVGLKAMKDTVESTASVSGALGRFVTRVPEDFVMPPGGLNIRPRDGILEQEARLQEYKRQAVVAWLKINRLNHIVMSGGPHARIGILTAGKSYLDVRQALDDLGIDEVRANGLGLRVMKLGCPWPVVPDELMSFAQGLELIIVVEEKRSLIEVQVREELYGSACQPVVIGKHDEQGAWLFPVKGALDANDIAIAIGSRILARTPDAEVAAAVARLKVAQVALAETRDAGVRIPYFCSGCPHNSSTKVPEGARAYAGIGCHYMAQWMDRSTDGYTQMGGEGANWIGEAPFSKRGHVFQNLGDGTYNHSGILALRFAVAAGTHITYKILFNDAVAMTGGQHHEGGLTVAKVAAQVVAEGAKRLVVVTDEPDKYAGGGGLPGGTSVFHRDDLMDVQRQLADVPGVSVMIYDQTCAAEKRRRRKRGEMIDPDKRVIINELVCEGCGDCGVASNCVSVQPLDTEFGRKRKIDQSSCNKDFSCVNGFCPSFVTVTGARIRKAEARPMLASPDADLPEPQRRQISPDRPFGILVNGVGGTGVVTIGAILGMAAHIEGLGCGMIDMAGLAQKGGAVYSHVKLATTPEGIHAIRVAAGEADLVLGCDLVVSGSKKVLASVRHGETALVINTAEVYPGDFARNADYALPGLRIKQALEASGAGAMHLIDAGTMATALLGTSIAANMFMLGFAWQQGYVPLAAASLEQAITLNGEAVAMNLAAFAWGRRAAHDPQAVAAEVAKALPPSPARQISTSLDDMIARRTAFLAAYQNAAYGAHYAARVAMVRATEQHIMPNSTALTEAVARYLFKLMAIKDEYEVGRLYSNGAFARQLADTFSGDLKLNFHLAPPLLAREGADHHPRKITLGGWMMPMFGLLAKAKVLRGTPLDLFGRSPERRAERALLAEYEVLLDELISNLSAENHVLGVALASLPEKIRGFGHVKAKNMASVAGERAKLLAQWRSGGVPMRAAAAE